VIRLLSEPVSWRTRSAAFFPALGDDLGGAEVAAEVRAVLAAAHEDGLLGASSLAAITADRPTAPSPITVTVVRSPTPALTAQWQFLAALPVSRWPRVLVAKIAAGGRSARCSSTGVSFPALLHDADHIKVGCLGSVLTCVWWTRLRRFSSVVADA
jgi:hypothetical protein